MNVEVGRTSLRSQSPGGGGACRDRVTPGRVTQHRPENLFPFHGVKPAEAVGVLTEPECCRIHRAPRAIVHVCVYIIVGRLLPNQSYNLKLFSPDSVQLHRAKRVMASIPNLFRGGGNVELPKASSSAE